MPGSITGKTQPWFTINEFLSEDVTADANIGFGVGAVPSGTLPSGWIRVIHIEYLPWWLVED